jgi:transcriptional regulator with GAF, ATPase, and Fis domain
MEAVLQTIQVKDQDNKIIDASLSHRIGALKELTQVLLDEVEDLESVKSLDISKGINIYDEVRHYETALIRRALRLTGGNQKRAARLLGLLPSTLNDKIKRYQIQLTAS